MQNRRDTIFLRESAKYPLPAFLEGKCSPSVYFKWLNCKADTLLKRDKKRGKPYAVAATKSVYKSKIHRAGSWQINDCKNDLTPKEFIGLCSNVAAYCSRHSTAQ